MGTVFEPFVALISQQCAAKDLPNLKKKNQGKFLQLHTDSKKIYTNQGCCRPLLLCFKLPQNRDFLVVFLKF